MCDPLTAAALALAAGGFATSQISQNQVSRERSRVAVAESARQEALQRRAIGKVDAATEEFTPDILNQGIEDAAQARTERLQGNAAGAGDQSPNDLPLTGSAPRVVRETAARELNRGLTEGKSFAARLGRLGSFGEAQFQKKLDLGRLSETLGQIGTESRNSANILPLELQTANRKGDTLAGISDILGSLGSVANLGSAVGADPFSTPKSTPPFIPGPVIT